MKLLSPQEVRSIQLSLLDEAAAFCKNYGLRYSLTGGTLIGAVRHKGYIPWDDDIDIMMPRPDYEMFIKSYQSKDSRIKNLMESGLCVESFSKLEMVGTIMKDVALGRSLWGVNIDLFPVDGFPEEGKQAYYDSLMERVRHFGQVCPFYKTVSSGRFKWALKYHLKRMIYPGQKDLTTLKSEVLTMLLSIDFEKAPNAALFCGGDGFKEIMPKRIFESYTQLEFENKTYQVIADYDTYLRNVFGDYMQLPPEEERRSHHEYDCYML